MMRQILLLVFVYFLLGGLEAQINDPVQWNFSIKKNLSGYYELHATATIDHPWHIYSQATPPGGPVASQFSFSTNPFVTLSGRVNERGELVRKKEDVFGIIVEYYKGSVDFVQLFKLKPKIKTNIAGTVKYMVCNDAQCLPPKTVAFNVSIK